MVAAESTVVVASKNTNSGEIPIARITLTLSCRLPLCFVQEGPRLLALSPLFGSFMGDEGAAAVGDRVDNLGESSGGGVEAVGVELAIEEIEASVPRQGRDIKATNSARSKRMVIYAHSQ